MFKFILLLLISSAAMTKELSIYLGDSEKPPYHIHQSAMTISTFNASVLGRLIELEEGFVLGKGMLQEFHYDFKKDAYILKLKDELFFHNGRKATSKDLEFSLTRGFYSPDKSFFNVYLGNIDGIEKIKSGDKFESGKVSGILLLDELTVQVKLKNSNPSFLHSLTIPYFALVPMEEYRDDYLTWKKWPIGAGEYKVLEPGFDGEKTILQLNKKFARNDKATRIIFFSRKVEGGTDITIDSEESSQFEIYQSNLPASVNILTFSNQHPLSQNENFRKGVNYVIDRNQFNSKAYGTSAADQMLPKHFWGRTDIKDIFQAEKAKEYFSKVPPELLKGPHTLVIFAGKELTEKQKTYTQKLEKIFRSVGFEAHFKPNSEKFETLETAKKSPIFAWGIVCDYVDPLIMFSAFKENGHSPYYGPKGTYLEQYEFLYQKAFAAKSFEERNAVVKELSEYVQKEAIVVAVSEAKITLRYNKSKISSLGAQNNPITLFLENIRMK